jgi:hypothetical protein
VYDDFCNSECFLTTIRLSSFGSSICIRTFYVLLKITITCNVSTVTHKYEITIWLIAIWLEHYICKNVHPSISDYSCAFQREILVHGRMYVTQNRICFHANIFKWETCLCIKFADLVHITKERTAMVIPNAIQVREIIK